MQVRVSQPARAAATTDRNVSAAGRLRGPGLAQSVFAADGISATRDHPLDILIVDDEESLRAPLAQYLERSGCLTTCMANAAQARGQLGTRNFDLVILDIMMPGEDGLGLCRFICERLDTPVILLTARTEDADRILGLELGADDYITKPFNPRELLARVRSVMKRALSAPPAMRLAMAQTLRFGEWTLHAPQRQLERDDGLIVPLTMGEFRLLQVFLMRPNVMLSRSQLLEFSQGREHSAFDRAIDNQVSRLRRKLERDIRHPRYIKTVWGGGYAFISGIVRP